MPVDDYKLSLIIYEAQFYKLPELVKTAEKVRSHMQRSLNPSRASVTSSRSTSGHYSAQKFKKISLAKEMAPKPVLSIRKISYGFNLISVFKNFMLIEYFSLISLMRLQFFNAYTSQLNFKLLNFNSYTSNRQEERIE